MEVFVWLVVDHLIGSKKRCAVVGLESRRNPKPFRLDKATATKIINV
jgi:hypothetical protein